VIQSITPGSLAASLDLHPGDEVLAVNGHTVEAMIDVQFYAIEDEYMVKCDKIALRNLFDKET
jgi:hypothetical protein